MYKNNSKTIFKVWTVHDIFFKEKTVKHYYFFQYYLLFFFLQTFLESNFPAPSTFTIFSIPRIVLFLSINTHEYIILEYLLFDLDISTRWLKKSQACQLFDMAIWISLLFNLLTYCSLCILSAKSALVNIPMGLLTLCLPTFPILFLIDPWAMSYNCLVFSLNSNFFKENSSLYKIVSIVLKNGGCADEGECIFYDWNPTTKMFVTRVLK